MSTSRGGGGYGYVAASPTISHGTVLGGSGPTPPQTSAATYKANAGVGGNGDGGGNSGRVVIEY